jgi:hypothetical protein
VVDTIEFTSSDLAVALPPPISIMDLESMTIEQRKSILIFEKISNVPLVDMDVF